MREISGSRARRALNFAKNFTKIKFWISGLSQLVLMAVLTNPLNPCLPLSLCMSSTQPEFQTGDSVLKEINPSYLHFAGYTGYWPTKTTEKSPVLKVVDLKVGKFDLNQPNTYSWSSQQKKQHINY